MLVTQGTGGFITYQRGFRCSFALFHKLIFDLKPAFTDSSKPTVQLNLPVL